MGTTQTEGNDQNDIDRAVSKPKRIRSGSRKGRVKKTEQYKTNIGKRVHKEVGTDEKQGKRKKQKHEKKEESTTHERRKNGAKKKEKLFKHVAMDFGQLAPSGIIILFCSAVRFN